MPELPEVETVRRILVSQVLMKKVSSLEIYREKNILTGAKELVSSLEGKTIRAIGRKGKYLLFQFDDFLLISHLRMEGKYLFYEDSPAPSKHDILCFRFEDGSSLFYNDVRKFGTFSLYPKLMEPSLLKKVGKEPKDLTPEEAKKNFAFVSKPIKEALLDQSKIAGLGNIYASEALFASKINPYSPACSLSIEDWDILLKEARRILEEAIEEGGSTIRSYHPGLGISGRMQNHLRVYHQNGNPCPNCGHLLIKREIGGRSSFFCPICQKKKDSSLVIGITGPIHAGKSKVASIFVNKGYLLFDADKEIKALYQKKEVQSKIKKAFGKKSFVDGKIDFSYLREEVSLHPKQKEKLEQILHPLVFQEAEHFLSIHGQNEKIVLDVPLLFGSPLEKRCDYILLVDASISIRKKRLLEENKDADALLKLNENYPLSLAKRKADLLLLNEGNEAELEKQIDSFGF